MSATPDPSEERTVAVEEDRTDEEEPGTREENEDERRTGEGTEGTPRTGEEGELPPEDELFHLLQNRRRRDVLRYLEGRTEPVRMRDVAEQVAAWENDTTVEQITSDQRQRVYIALYQSHLSTLDDAGVIEYNQPRGVVKPTPLVDDVARYLNVDDDGETRDVLPEWIWSAFYLAASAFSTILYGASSIPVVASRFSSITLGAFTVLLFTTITVVRMATKPV